MASNRLDNDSRARAPRRQKAAAENIGKRTPGERAAHDAGLNEGSDLNEITGRQAQEAAIEQAMARQNVKVTSSAGPVGPIGRTVLTIAFITLAGLIGAWFLAMA